MPGRTLNEKACEGRKGGGNRDVRGQKSARTVVVNTRELWPARQGKGKEDDESRSRVDCFKIIHVKPGRRRQKHFGNGRLTRPSKTPTKTQRRRGTDDNHVALCIESASAKNRSRSSIKRSGRLTQPAFALTAEKRRETRRKRPRQSHLVSCALPFPPTVDRTIDDSELKERTSLDVERMLGGSSTARRGNS